MKLFLSCVILALSLATSRASTCVCVATWEGGALNIRSCASTTCSILGVENAGKCYGYLGDAGGGWHEIDYNGQSGFASGEYMAGPQECSDGGSDCYGAFCSSNPANTFRTCDSYGCGNYGASRGSRGHGGVDVECSAGATMYAPITGTFGRAIPYGDGTCCDDGFYIDGTGAWAGHSIMVFYTNPDDSLFGTTVNQGDVVGTHLGLLCGNCYGAGMTDHSHIQDDYNGVEVDPSSWINCGLD